MSSTNCKVVYQTNTTICHLSALGLSNFIRGFRWAYNRGSQYLGGLILTRRIFSLVEKWPITGGVYKWQFTVYCLLCILTEHA